MCEVLIYTPEQIEDLILEDVKRKNREAISIKFNSSIKYDKDQYGYAVFSYPDFDGVAVKLK